MDVKNLEYVLEIARQRNISRAADALYLSQSTLSQFLLRLEQELGTPLFHRTKGGVVLTQAGELYIKAAEEVLEIRRRLYSDIAALAGAGRLRVGVSSRWGVQMLAELLPEFHRDFPDMSVEIFQSKFQQLKQQWKEEKLDLAITAVGGDEDFPGEYRLLRGEEICLVAPKQHQQTGGQLTAQELNSRFKEEYFIRSDKGSSMHQVEQAFFKATGFQPRVICEVNDNLAALRMVEQGAGVAFIPVSYAAQSSEVTCWRLTPPLERKNILAVSPHLQHNPALLKLVMLIEGYHLFQSSNQAAE